MTPDVWRQVEDLYHTLRDRTLESRAAILAQATPEVRRLVETMLAQSANGGPSDAYPRSLPGPSIGSLLGPYRIEALLGAGAMGTVYRAVDTRLRRRVAIKVPRQSLSSRFEREARAIAALNHPNICAIHDVGPNYLVMEFIEGPTLADRIGKGPIPIDDALEMARQIAQALDAAHERSIVHRDLKPANIKITTGVS